MSCLRVCSRLSINVDKLTLAYLYLKILSDCANKIHFDSLRGKLTLIYLNYSGAHFSFYLVVHSSWFPNLILPLKVVAVLMRFVYLPTVF